MTYDDLLPFIWPSCGGCPRDTVIHHTRQAAIEFFDRTLVWQVDLDTLLADGFSTRYTLPLSDQVDLAKLLTVAKRTSPTARPEEADLTEAIAGRRAIRFGAPGFLAWVEDRKDISVYPAPEQNAEIDVFAALKPSLGSFWLPDEVLGQQADHIAQGALARILDMPNPEWNNPRAAELARGRFYDEVNRLAVQSELGFARRVRSKSERFF